MKRIVKFESFIIEGRESKKPKSEYFTKRVAITKLDLEEICQNLNLEFNKVKFLSSGSYGNAYQIGDKVLKITTDMREAKTAYDIINSNQKEGVVKYYDVSRFKIKDRFLYVILMDYVTPLDKYLSEHIKGWDAIEFVEDIIVFICDRWTTLKSKDEIMNYLSEYYVMGGVGFTSAIVDKIWNLYQKIKTYTKDYPDLHPFNMGIKSDGEIVLFDFTDLETVRKFDKPRILPHNK